MTVSAPFLATTTAQLDRFLADNQPAKGRRAVVMTMGALHEGHLELVRAAKEAATQVIVTIFVNPLQFGPGEDYEAYPRTLEADLALLTEAGVDAVFAPSPQEMYPDTRPLVTVSAGHIGTVLEGAIRPGHFDGMLTVVLKLLNLTRPDLAFFGQKDAQQLLLIQRMVKDFNLGVKICPVPIVRQEDGLALSSRNSYLSQEERETALTLSRALTAAQLAAQRGATAGQARAVAAQVIEQIAGLTLDYLVVVDPQTIAQADEDYRGSALTLIAARVGSTRLIDNMPVEIAP
ncbi:pantoate--beta-alanine ligase [Jonesiaceae bacterium BS-20]|uniref:Pantothenate synthetase n=1 Tax=Jonesiaceae bacterium BS-20 TaxID=3120821 RepID=A0AAU7DVM8_9MICO